MPPADAPALRDYEVTGVVSGKGDDIVYAGRHRLTGHPVALHRIPPQLAGAAGYTERLTDMARRVAALRNPHVVGVYDLVAEDGIFLVLELVPGVSLRELAPAGSPLPPASALAAADDVLNALESAHAQGVVHGDVQPEQVLVTGMGSAKLGGFAESQALLLLPNHPGAKRPGYSSPERMSGSTPDARSDLYAAAALASELLTGHAPSPGRIGPPALPAVQEVLQRALAPEVHRRYDTAAALRAALIGAVAASLGPSWRLASDLAARATGALAARGETAPVSPAPVSSTGLAAGGAGRSVAGFSTPPPPGATVLSSGVTPPPPTARPPSTPPPSYLPPPEPRSRAEITELDGEERRRPWLIPLLAVLALVVLAGAGVGIAVATGAIGGGTAVNNGPVTVGSDVQLSVSPSQGQCNTTFAFVATGSVTGRGTLVYRWERSDGRRTADIPVDLDGKEGSFKFTTDWRVVGHQQLQGQMTFRVVSPSERVVNKGVSYNCP